MNDLELNEYWKVRKAYQKQKEMRLSLLYAEKRRKDKRSAPKIVQPAAPDPQKWQVIKASAYNLLSDQNMRNSLLRLSFKQLFNREATEQELLQ